MDFGGLALRLGVFAREQCPHSPSILLILAMAIRGLAELVPPGKN